MKMEKWFVEKREYVKSVDPIGQSYLPGYFCPAALFDSRETTQGEGGAETTQRDYCSSDQTEMNRNKTVTGH